MTRESVITCPQCGTAKAETMPTDACQFFYRCTGCGRVQVVAVGGPEPACCGGELISLLEPLIQDGRLVRTLPEVQAIRQQVLADLERVSL